MTFCKMGGGGRWGQKDPVEYLGAPDCLSLFKERGYNVRDSGNLGFGGRGKVGGKMMEWVDCSRGTWKREAAVSPPNELGEEGWVLPKRVECWAF